MNYSSHSFQARRMETCKIHWWKIHKKKRNSVEVYLQGPLGIWAFIHWRSRRRSASMGRSCADHHRSALQKQKPSYRSRIAETGGSSRRKSSLPNSPLSCVFGWIDCRETHNVNCISEECKIESRNRIKRRNLFRNESCCMSGASFVRRPRPLQSTTVRLQLITWYTPFFLLNHSFLWPSFIVLLFSIRCMNAAVNQTSSMLIPR